jgi:hypothetical protein
VRGVTFAWLLAGCAAPPVAPPTDFRAAAHGDAVLLSWKRSVDDGGGRGVVRGYAVLRAHSRAGPFVPFDDAKVEDAPQGRVAVRDPAPLWDLAFYQVWAIPERESGSPSHAGGTASAAMAEVFSAVEHPGKAPRPPRDARASAPDSDDGTHVAIAFRTSQSDRDGSDAPVAKYVVLRARASVGPYLPFADDEAPAGEEAVADDPAARAVREDLVHALVGKRPSRASRRLAGQIESQLAGSRTPDPASAFARTVTDSVADGGPFYYRVFAVPDVGPATATRTLGPVRPNAALFGAGKAGMAVLLGVTFALTVFFVRRAQRAGASMYIRRIAGVDALEEAIGRATEMGRPVLYVPGIDEIQNIQTIASILILGRVSELVARYDAEIKVPCCIPLVATVAEEVVRQGFYNAGRPDAHRPQNVQWISSEQFAFCAGTNGIMLREKPATNIYLGRFFAESLILAETGYVNRAIQIGGTAEITQLPFFIAACDYTLIGEELFAVSAYMTREPRLLGTLKAADWVKVGLLVVATGMALAAIAVWSMAPFPHGSAFASACLDVLAFLSPGGA